jgi:hypothetical protein
MEIPYILYGSGFVASSIREEERGSVELQNEVGGTAYRGRGLYLLLKHPLLCLLWILQLS